MGGAQSTDESAQRAVACTDGTNGVPKLGDGRVAHLGLRAGELAPRIVSVGSLGRAQRLCELLDKEVEVFELTSARGFTTFTGAYKGVRVSIVATGMGMPMMDYLVREARAIVSGPMAIIRYGSCRGLTPTAVPGAVVVNTSGSVSVTRNPDAFPQPWDRESEGGASGSGSRAPGGDADAYRISRPVPPNPSLARALGEAMETAVGARRTVEGLNASCDSFYSSQGRVDTHFDDRNEQLVARLTALHPKATSMEMESFQLLHLAACSRGSISAATAAVVAANAASTQVLSSDVFYALELDGARAVLHTLSTWQLGEGSD